MKFVQVTDGQQFEYEGESYTKKGPMMAVNSKGNSKLLARSAVVKPLTGTTPDTTAPKKNPQLDMAQVTTALDIFYTICLDLLNDTDHVDKNEARNKLALARQDFLDKLKG